MGTDHHRLFAIDTILETDLSDLTGAQAESFLAESRGWLARVPEVWLGGRHRHAEQKRGRTRDREKLGELRARLEASGGGRSSSPLSRLFSKNSPRRAEPDAGRKS